MLSEFTQRPLAKSIHQAYYPVPTAILAKWQKTVDLLACVLEVAVARITQATPDQLLLLVSNQSPANPFFLEKPAFVYYNSYCAQVVLSAKPLVVINTELDGRSEHNSDVTLGMLAYEGLPLFWPSGELFGTLAVLDKTPRTFTPLQEQLLQHFKEGCESELKILFNESHERADSIHSSQNVLFQKLVSVVHAASANSNLLATLQNAMEVVASITSAEYGSMIVLNEKGAVTDNIVGLNAWALDIKEAIYSSLIEYGLAGWVFRQREVALVSDTLTDSRWLRLPEQPSQARSALVVPVMRGELLAGIMVLLHSQPSHFGVEQIKLIVPASEHLALLLDNIRLQGLARQEKESRQSTESQLYLSEGRYQAISEMTSDFAFSLVINSNGSFEVEWVTDAFFRVTNYSLEELMKPEGWKLLVHPDDAAQAVRYAKSVMAGHAGVVEFRIITRRGEVRWVRLYVKREWDTEKRKLIRILGAGQDITEQKQAEEALQHANEELNGWVSELEQHTREIGLLNEMGDLFRACRTAEEAYTVVAQVAPRLFPNDAGALLVMSESRNSVDSVVVWGMSLPTNTLFGPDDCWALRREHLHLVDDTANGLLCPHLQTPLPGTYMCVPMIVQGQAIGVLHLSQAGTASFSEAKQHLAATVAEHIALALANLELQETLRSQSIRDPLTDLFNRRYMEESLEREMRRAVRNRSSLGIIMLDLDHFKVINDTYGHDAGDAVLRELGSLLQNNIRGEDIACRYGGEEFTLILPDVTLQDVTKRARELNEAIARLKVPYRNFILGSLTASQGVAIFPTHGSTVKAVLLAADAALYAAKQAGRDRVMVAAQDTLLFE